MQFGLNNSPNTWASLRLCAFARNSFARKDAKTQRRKGIWIFVLVISFGFLSASSYSQSIDSLKIFIKNIQRGENDSIRESSNRLFLTGFEKLLQKKESFTMNMDSLKNISVHTSEDEKIRIYTWVVPQYEGNKYTYFGFVQFKLKSSDTTFHLVQLKDSTEMIRKPEAEKLNADRWFGAIYYKMLPVKRGKITYYTLLGWKAKDKMVTQKVIDVLYIDKEKAKFGYPIFKTGSVYKNRMVFSFNAQVSMALSFDKKVNGIVFDHLGTNKNNLTGLEGPDGTYDALKFSKGRWELSHDIDARVKTPEKE